MREGKHFDSKRGERRNMRGRHLSTPERRRRLPDAKPHYRQMPGKAPKKENEEKEYRYYVLWKPYGVAARNEDVVNARPLKSYVPVEGVSPVGFLDANSEGILLLTDNPCFRFGLNHAKCQETRIFLAQVELAEDEEMVSDQALDAMAEGVVLNEGRTLPLEVDVIEDPQLPQRSLPVKEDINTCWLAITCSEGWSRHIRRITAALGYPTLRLVQWAIGPISLYEMTEGQLRELRQREMHWVRSVLERTPMPVTPAERSRFRSGPHRPAKPHPKNSRWAVKEDGARRSGEERTSARETGSSGPRAGRPAKPRPEKTGKAGPRTEQRPHSRRSGPQNKSNSGAKPGKADSRRGSAAHHTRRPDRNGRGGGASSGRRAPAGKR